MKPEEMWSRFCSENGIDPATHYEAWQFGGAPDNLAALVMLGIKYATASLYDLYEVEDEEPMPQEGDYSVILDSKDEAVCVIQTIQLDVIPFDEVGEDQARGEGEGDKSLSYWRKVHDWFFREQAKEYGVEFHAKSRVLCEKFKLCYSAYTVSKMTEAEAREVVSWEYAEPYSVYNLPEWDKCEELGLAITDLEQYGEAFYSVKKEGVFLGYFHIENNGEFMELSVGIKPELCGQGNGSMFMELALATIEDMDSKMPVKLTVRPFNKRAIQCYEKVGFKITREYYEDSYITPSEMYEMILER